MRLAFARSMRALGLTLALQCDLRVAAEDARLGVLQVRRGVMPEVVLNNLYQHTQMQTVFGINLVALVDGLSLEGQGAEGEGAKAQESVPDERGRETAGLGRPGRRGAAGRVAGLRWNPSVSHAVLALRSDLGE